MNVLAEVHCLGTRQHYYSSVPKRSIHFIWQWPVFAPWFFASPFIHYSLMHLMFISDFLRGFIYFALLLFICIHSRSAATGDMLLLSQEERKKNGRQTNEKIQQGSPPPRQPPPLFARNPPSLTFEPSFRPTSPGQWDLYSLRLLLQTHRHTAPSLTTI